MEELIRVGKLKYKAGMHFKSLLKQSELAFLPGARFPRIVHHGSSTEFFRHGALARDRLIKIRDRLPRALEDLRVY
jgi:hypothetical protein